MSVSAAPRQLLKCEHCNRNRFYVFRLTSGRLVLQCYSCHQPLEVEQRLS